DVFSPVILTLLFETAFPRATAQGAYGQSNWLRVPSWPCREELHLPCDPGHVVAPKCLTPVATAVRAQNGVSADRRAGSLIYEVYRSGTNSATNPNIGRCNTTVRRSQ